MRSLCPARVALSLTLLSAPLLLPSLGCRPPASGQKASKEKRAQKKKRPERPAPKDPWLDEIVAAAEVTVTAAEGPPTRCAWDAGRKRHVCDGQPGWLYVGPQALKVGPSQTYCVWQHPISGGKVTTRLPGVAKEPLDFAHAFAGPAAALTEGAPVEVTLRVDGQEKNKLTRERAPGFDRVALEPAPEGGAGDLEVEVTTANDGAAHFCWQLKRKRAPEVRRASRKEAGALSPREAAAAKVTGKAGAVLPARAIPAPQPAEKSGD